MLIPDVKIAIAGCCRDAARFLPQTLRNMQRIGDMFASVQYIFAESDSADNSLEILNRFYERHPNTCRIVSFGNLRDSLPWRTQRLAFVRNFLLDACRAMYEDGLATHMLMMDMDNVGARQFSQVAVSSCFAYTGWTAMASSDVRWHYDLWALRWPGVFDADILRAPGAWALRKQIARACSLPRNALPVIVRSAFNGAAIYDLSLIKPEYRYVGLLFAEDEEDVATEVCEHVTFHEQIVDDGGVILINPQFAPS